MTPSQGEIWWAEIPELGRRPVLIVTRDAAIPVLRAVLVAPITRTVRQIPTEVPVGPDEGLPSPSVASFDNLQPIPRSTLTERAGRLGSRARAEICGALAAMSDC